jgi:hypothetical protein
MRACSPWLSSIRLQKEAAERPDRPPTVTPSASSMAWTELIWQATGQMPQMRARRCPGACCRRGHANASEKPGRLEDAQLGAFTRLSRMVTVSAPRATTRARFSTLIS